MATYKGLPRNRELRDVVVAALRAGCTIQHGGKHSKVVCPNGRKIPFSTAKDKHPAAAQLMRKQLRANGVDV